ncbi:MAG: cytidylate kinase-like family protein [Clostridia bacterium]|nr:cytidylate kinase-like family protein [Clostridia bacterium]
MNRIITIGREFGSGGREIGLLLSEKLGIPFYDKEIITLTAEAGGISEDLIKAHEEGIGLAGKKIASRMKYASFMYSPSLSDSIFLHQCDAIRKLASSGPCVIVGRCADYVLRDMGSVNVFIASAMDSKVKRKRAMAPEKADYTEKEFEKWISDVNEARCNYYEHYTKQGWGRIQNYHLCIHSDLCGIQGAVDTIIAYLSAIEKK